MNPLLRPVLNFLKCGFLSALAGVFLVPSAGAEVAEFYNNGPLVYSIPGNPPPQIDARAFCNDGAGGFTVNYNSGSPGVPFYETLDTLYYTNNGTMIANSPAAAFNPAGLYSGSPDFGFGYQFDLQTLSGFNYWADTFCNLGTIRAVSTIDGNNLLANVFFLGTSFSQIYEVTSYGEVVVAATNIVNHGIVDVSEGGLIRFAGRNVDLSQSQLIVESPLNVFGSLGTANYSSTGLAGLDTNGDWNPGVELTPTTALSSLVAISPYYLQLTNCLAYQDIRTKGPATNSLTIYRYVFVENIPSSPDVTYNVYIDDPGTVSLGFAAGAAHVEWIANYTDAASGNPVANYLYLTDDYALGMNSTNDPNLNGIPRNFSFATATSELLTGALSPVNYGTVPPFQPPPDAIQTNNYACFFANMSASTVPTNASVLNPHGTITNLPGQVLIMAGNELNLANATITSPNYLNLYCTNQFDGSVGGTISAPYSDLALGVTNGFLTISNLLIAQLPNWSGQIQAWSSDWFATNSVSGGSNEYKVLLVYSSLLPTTPPWTKNCYLHATNTLTLSDALNVYGSFYSDAQVLTLNTNQVGAGATSLYGQLIWANPAPFNANSGSGLQQMPNLLWLTNNGVFSAASTANFGNPAAPPFTVTPVSPALPATGTLSLTVTGTNAVLGDKVTIGTNQYVFVGTLTNTRPNQVKWAKTFAGSMTNLIAAINGVAGAGAAYSSATRSNTFVKAGPLVNNASFTVTARTNGASGNLIATAFTPAKPLVVNLTWGGATLAGGVNALLSTNPTAFINRTAMADQGATIWTSYFENDGTISNGLGSFVLHTGQALILGSQPPTNSSVVASGDILLMATNHPATGMNGILISNVLLQAGRELTLWSTNIYDGGVSSGNIFVVGAASAGSSMESGFNVPVMPPAGAGDLLGTTVTNIAPLHATIYNVWAGTNLGISDSGYSHNLALGHLVLDSLTTNLSYPPVAFVFNGVGVSNGLYVDLLELKDGATQGNTTNNYNFPWLKINTNMFIYYARAIEDRNGQTYDVSEAIDYASRVQGANGGRLRWIYSYPGYFSSTNFYYTNWAGVVVARPENLALAQSPDIDSDSDGIVNSLDSTPFFLPSELNFSVSVTNLPPPSLKVEWTTIPNATNFVYYTTNLHMPFTNSFTNFTHWFYGNNVAVTNAAHGNSFPSPQVYYGPNPALPDNGQQTNVWFYAPTTNGPHYYRVKVSPWLNFTPP